MWSYILLFINKFFYQLIHYQFDIFLINYYYSHKIFHDCVDF